MRNPGTSILLPRSSAILEGISYQSTGSNDVTIELPPNWYGNNDLLGFAIYCVWDPSRIGSHRCEYGLKIRGNDEQEYLGYFPFDFFCPDFHPSAFVIPVFVALDLACIMCYPKVAIREKYRSKKWTHIVASFHGSTRVEGCGIHLIYAKD